MSKIEIVSYILYQQKTPFVCFLYFGAEGVLTFSVIIFVGIEVSLVSPTLG